MLEDGRGSGNTHLAGGNTKGFSHFESLLVVSCKHTHLYDPAPLLPYLPQRNDISVHTRTCNASVYVCLRHTSRGTLHRLCSVVNYLLSMVTRDQWLRPGVEWIIGLYLWEKEESVVGFPINLNQLSNSSSWFRDGQGDSESNQDFCLMMP